MSDDDTVRVNHIVPRHVREAAQKKTDHGELSERVRSLYRRTAFGEDYDENATIKMELERVRDEKDEKRAKMRELRAELESLESKETRLEEKVSKHESLEQKYEGHLESLESALKSGNSLSEKDARVEMAANTGECEPEEVIQTLKERNPEIPDHAFTQAVGSDEWDGVGGGR